MPISRASRSVVLLLGLSTGFAPDGNPGLAAGSSSPRLVRAPGSPSDGARVTLPAGRAERTWAGVGPETEPAELDLDGVPSAAPIHWTDEEWDAWAADVAATVAENAASASAPAAHARLALTARASGRDADAWRHFAATGADPHVSARLLAGLIPGVEPAALAGVGPGGRLGRLPDGVLLAPAVPPAAEPDGRDAGAPPSWTPARTIYAGLAVGDAVIDVVVRREAEGIQIDLVHVSGGACTLRMQIPEPEGYEVRVEYVLWYRQETVGLPHEVRVEPDQSEPASLFGRMLPRRGSWPTSLPDALPLALEQRGIRLVANAGDDVAARGLARAWNALFGVATEVATERTDSGDAPPPGLVVDLSGEGASRKLTELTTLTERWFGSRD